LNVAPGTRFGAYEIVSALGAGGMGEVYRARDAKLNRDVAIKILPDVFAHDSERVARFTREAQTLASLNHPNIAQIYGVLEEDQPAHVHALVMELVEGDDLSVLIARGPMPLPEALPIAKQIAEALEAAHEQGIVHRDLKPANVKVRADGTVKVLDFGLAKALDPGSKDPGLHQDVANSPTLTARATQMGMIIGTAAYMAPEQAKGKRVDKRADIWAFGVVLYEMLTGSRLFAAEDVSETLAAVLTREVNLKTLPPGTPVRLRALVGDCLIRDSKQRLRDIGNARIEIARFEASGPDSAGPVPPTLAVAAAPAWRRALPWAWATVSTVALLAGLLTWAPWRSAPAPTPRKLLASIGADASLPTTQGASAILSPDGTTLAFVARQAGQARLFIRKLDQLQAAPLAGTEGAENPFFSPDGQWLAFFGGGALKKVSVTGGAAVPLCEAVENLGGTWADDDTIVFTRSGAPNARLMRVSAAGGTPEDFGAALSPGAGRQRWPQALPGGQAVLYSEHSPTSTNWDAANLVVAPLSGGAPKVVVRGGYYGRYVPSGRGSPKRDEREGGHLIYLHQGTVFAVRFDLTRLETVGPAAPALEGVTAFPAAGGAKLAASSEGTLVYVPGTAASAARPIDWLTRDGKTAVLRATNALWANPRFSPNGQKLAVDISDGTQRDIWVYEWARDTLTQLTFDPGEDRFPVWTPDGRRLVFASDRGKAGTFNLYWANADGTGEVTRLTDSPESHSQGSSWHPSGQFLAFQASRGATGTDLMILPMEGDATRGWTPGTPTVFLSSPASEATPMFSPDGRWIAYASTEAGSSSFDIYVRPFPGPGGPWRISTAGGRFPRWSATAPELLFVGQATIMAARYTVVGDSFRSETPQMWSPTSIQGVAPGNAGYALHPDGKRVAAAAVADESDGLAHDKVVFFFNFSDYLKKVAPGKQ